MFQTLRTCILDVGLHDLQGPGYGLHDLCFAGGNRVTVVIRCTSGSRLVNFFFPFFGDQSRTYVVLVVMFNYLCNLMDLLKIVRLWRRMPQNKAHSGSLGSWHMQPKSVGSYLKNDGSSFLENTIIIALH